MFGYPKIRRWCNCPRLPTPVAVPDPAPEPEPEPTPTPRGGFPIIIVPQVRPQPSFWGRLIRVPGVFIFMLDPRFGLDGALDRAPEVPGVDPRMG
jgi:hypothetical protein